MHLAHRLSERIAVLRVVTGWLPDPQRYEIDDRFVTVHGLTERFRIDAATVGVQVWPDLAPRDVRVPVGAEVASLGLPYDDDPILMRVLALMLHLAAS